MLFRYLDHEWFAREDAEALSTTPNIVLTPDGPFRIMSMQ